MKVLIIGYFLKHNGIGTADSSTGSAAIQSFYFDLSKEINAVVTIVFAFFVLGEKITILGAVGALITILGLFISEKKD